LKRREYDCFLPAQVPGLTGSRVRDQVDVRRDRAEPGGRDRLTPHTLHGGRRRGALPDLAAIDEQDDAHRIGCHRRFLLASLRLHTPLGLPLESTCQHGRLCQEAPRHFTITQEGKVAIDSGTSGERGKDWSDAWTALR